MRDLNEVRRDITDIDRQIVDLFLRRMHCSEEVSDYKMATGGAVYVPSRETELLSTLLAKVPEQYRLEYTALLKTTMRISRKHQYERMLSNEPERLQLPIHERIQAPSSVCYQGLPGSYQHYVAQKLFPNAEQQYLPTWEDVFRQVSEGKTDIGVVPVENSTAGTVNEVYDLLEAYGLSISHSYIAKIRHCLCACPGTSIERIRSVHSHPQALRQCHSYIKSHGFSDHSETNTAVAAELVRQKNDPSVAAICSEAAAKLYGLEILERGVNDGSFNQTRFIAVTRELSAKPEDTRVSLILTLPHVCGSLSSALAVFGDYGVNMTEIHSRPLPDMPWNYCFYVDFDGNLLHADTRALVYQMIQELPAVRVLGSFPVISEEDT